MRTVVLSMMVLLLAVGCGVLPLPAGNGEDGDGNGDGGGTNPARTPLWSTAAHFAPVLDLTWSPDADLVAVFAQHAPLNLLRADDGEAIDWRTTSTWWPPHCAFGGGISWSPGGERVAVSSVVLDAETWSLTATLALDEAHMSDALAFSPDGTRIAGGSRPTSGGQVGCICLVVWDPATGERLLTLDAPGNDGHRGYISGVAWSPDGRRVLTTAWWAQTGVFDLAAAEQVLELPSAASAAWSPDGRRIVLAHTHDPWADDAPTGVVSVVDASSGAALLERSVLGAPVRAIAWHPAGERIVVGGADGAVVVLDAATLASLERIDVLGPVTAVRFAPDGASVAVGTGAGVVHLLPAALAGPSVRAPVGRGEVVATAWSPDGQHLASGGTDGVVAVRRADTGTVVAEWAMPGDLRSLVWSPDGRWLAAAAQDVSLIETETWERRLATPDDFGRGATQGLAFGPDGTLAILTYEAVHAVDPATMAQAWRFSPGETTGDFVVLWQIAWSPSGTDLALVTHDGELWSLDLAPDAAAPVRRTPTAYDRVDAVAYSGDGSMLVLTGSSATGDERRVTVLDVASLEALHDVPFASGSGSTVSAGFTAQDDWFWAAGTAWGCGCPDTTPGANDAVKAWSVADGQRTFGLDTPRHVGAAAFDRDGARLAVGSLTGELSLWAVP